MEARVCWDWGTIGKKAAMLAAASFCASVMVLAVPAEEALAYGGTQTDATTSSVTATLDLGDYYMGQNPQMLYVEAAPEGTNNYSRVFTSVLTPTQMTVVGLDPGTEYSMKVYFRYGSGYESSSYVYDLCTVPDQVSALAITSMYPSFGQMRLGFTSPGTIYGFEVEMDAMAGKKYDKTIKKSWNYAYNYSKVVESDDVKMNLKTAYIGRVRTYVKMGDGTKKWSEWSKKAVLVPQPILNSKYTNSGSGVKVSWNKCVGAKSYTLYGSTKNGSYKKILTTKSTSASFNKIKGSKLKKGKKYYIYAQANVPVSGKTYTSHSLRISYFTY